MAIPALRQPKLLNELQDSSQTAIKDVPNVIVTLKDNKKLLVSSDAYQGIIKTSEMYKCVFCGTDMQLDAKYKDCHVDSARHKECLRTYPHVDEYGHNLIRKLNERMCYCTICNVIVASPFLGRHIASLLHSTDLDKAMIRASVYDQ